MDMVRQLLCIPWRIDLQLWTVFGAFRFLVLVWLNLAELVELVLEHGSVTTVWMGTCWSDLYEGSRIFSTVHIRRVDVGNKFDGVCGLAWCRNVLQEIRADICHSSINPDQLPFLNFFTPHKPMTAYQYYKPDVASVQYDSAKNVCFESHMCDEDVEI